VLWPTKDQNRRDSLGDVAPYLFGSSVGEVANLCSGRGMLCCKCLGVVMIAGSYLLFLFWSCWLCDFFAQLPVVFVLG